MDKDFRLDIKDIVGKVDHTLLSQTVAFDDIKTVIDDGFYFGAKTACIPPCFVADAVAYSGGRLPICTVIGFPNGYNETKIKVYEAESAVNNGALEIDMVINIGRLKTGDYDYVRNEIRDIKNAIGEHILKVIVETCLLTEQEKIRMCEIVNESGADFIKTSTGFSKSGATFEDIELFKKHSRVKIKAAGGIGSLEDAERFILLGASRLGTSKVIGILKNRKDKEEGGY